MRRVAAVSVAAASVVLLACVLGVVTAARSSVNVQQKDTRTHRFQYCGSTNFYVARFTSNWTAANQPHEFPANAHFSPLVGTGHDASYVMWRLGTQASPGVVSMAETGSTAALVKELEAAKGKRQIEAIHVGSGIAAEATIPQDEIVVRATSTRPLVSLVSMVAPSPDWFVGIDSLELYDSRDGCWKQRVTLDVYAVDAGSDSGATFTAANNATVPQEVVTAVNMSAVFAGPGHKVRALGTLLLSGKHDCECEPRAASYGCAPTLCFYYRLITSVLFGCLIPVSLYCVVRHLMDGEGKTLPRMVTALILLMSVLRCVTYALLLVPEVPINQLALNLVMFLPVGLTFNAYSTLVFYFVLMTKGARAQLKQTTAGIPTGFRNSLIVINVLAIVLPATLDIIRWYSGISMSIYNNTFSAAALFFVFAGFVRYGNKLAGNLKESRSISSARGRKKLDAQVTKVIRITTLASVFFVITMLILLVFTFLPDKDDVNLVVARHSVFRLIEWALGVLILVTFWPRKEAPPQSESGTASGGDVPLRKTARINRV